MNTGSRGPDSSFLKSETDYCFSVRSTSGVSTESRPTIQSTSGDLRVFVNGVIYGDDEWSLLDAFYQRGLKHIESLEGSFIIFIIEKNRLHILTDKFNSKKAFYTRKDDSWYISNNIDNLTTNTLTLSIEALACFLASGVMYNNLTIFEEIIATQRATIYTFENELVSLTKYWDFDFKYSADAISKKPEYKEELKRLLIDSVRRRYAVSSNTAVSLSAGHEARGILGILRSEIKAQQVTCFSYASAESPLPHTDAALSRRIADLCGYPHQIHLSYQGDLIGHLIKNAREGKCFANYCDELDAWYSLLKSDDFSDIFVGEHCFGWVDAPLRKPYDALDCLSINGPEAIRWLKRHVGKETYRTLCKSLTSTRAAILESTDHISELHDKKDYLYLDQRTNHVLMPWRENFSGKIGCIHFPYLDGKIVDFVRTFPPEFRRKKSLFKETIREMCPEVFSIPLAESTGVITDWRKELRRNRKALIDLVQDTNSRLDEVIPPSAIISAIRSQGSVGDRSLVFAKRVLGHVRRQSRFVDRLAGSRPLSRWITVFRGVNPDRLLLRLLTLRIYLSGAEVER